MSFYHFPSEFVYWDNLENHEEIKNKLLPLIKEKANKIKNNPFDACKMNTSCYRDNRLHTENEFLKTPDILKSVVSYNMEKMINRYNNLNIFKIKHNSSLLTSCWWNIYEDGDFQEEHDHNGEPLLIDNKVFYPSFSMIYILHDESKESGISFKKYAPIPCRQPHSEMVVRTSYIKDIKEGSIVMFPYNLKHYVEPCIKSGRVTISYNIYSTF